MKTSNVEQIIKELATQNFNSYPENYELDSDGLVSMEIAESVQDLAISYYENRTEDEIERDEYLSISKTDYVNFVMEAFESYIQD